MTLIENCRSWWKLWSVRIHALMSAALAGLVYAHKPLEDAMSALPAAVQTAMPWVLGAIIFAIGTMARLTPQPKVAADAQPPAN